MSLAMNVSAGSCGRVILVIGGDGELAGALRDRLDRAYVTVVEPRGGEEVEVVRSCRPWPWMVVGAGEELDPMVLAELCRSPALVVWRAPPPPGVPAHAVVARRFSGMVAAVEAALGGAVAGMRLAVGSGVELPGGRHVANAALETLVASHPRPVVAGASFARSAARVLAHHGIAARPVAAPGGAVVLTTLAAG